ncbi:MAG: DMT family transporter [Nitrospinaceae bacterium]|nr:DMT family transporter [Nitrospinaceae bacterium]MBT3821789.1 DMT family transporter [Nitrospinaceae bacterium]MBT4093126.1 DMT family transporter [Nitrospinaceae bacterium]MBT4431493.1 DMT family transporter [Nitrospinaceae bacterium]MBT5367662.1 DMT family transporter [Nitrospinaceae bacterium]
MLETIHPNLLALTGALCSAIARMFYKSALSHLSPTFVTVLVNFISVLFAALFYFLGDGVSDWPIEGLLWFAFVGLVGSLFGRYMSLLSIRLTGVARATIVMQTVLIWSTAIAIIFLGERLSVGVAAGSLLIMFGGVLLVYEKEEVRKRIPLVYYLAPLLAAFSLAFTFLLRRYGLLLIPSSPLGMGVSNLTALVALSAALPFTDGGMPDTRETRGFLIAALGGVFNAGAVLCFWTAVQTGKVVEVVPINRLSVLFVILFSWLFFQRQELISLRVVLGGLLSVAGAYVIVVGH